MGENSEKGNRSPNKIGFGLVIGTGIGVTIGVATDNLAVWIGIGVAIGAALGAGWESQSKRDDESQESD